MHLHRRFRRWWSSGLVVVVLFAQLLTAAYACPKLTANVAALMTMSDMPGCEGMKPAALDPEQPQLCQAHCTQGAKALQSAPGVDVPDMAPVLLAILDWSPAKQLGEHGAPQRLPLASGASPPGASPIYLSLLVLRQ